MAINKNHEFEDVDGVKCGIVEKNASPERVAFLKQILEYNGYEVKTAPTPPPKAAPAKPVAEGETPPPPPPPPPATFTIGVTDYTFNPINAIFGRILKAPTGDVVSLAYWKQEEKVNDVETPYFDKA